MGHAAGFIAVPEEKFARNMLAAFISTMFIPAWPYAENTPIAKRSRARIAVQREYFANS
jgi:hypothetical protein